MIYLQISDTITDAFQSASVDESTLESAAKRTLEYTGTPTDTDLSIVLTDDTQIHQLNLEFRDVDAPTDVLSFPGGEIDPDTGKPYLGDVIISFKRADAQAQTAGHPLGSELKLLVVHGVLHLLGYDHQDEKTKAEMWSAQDDILAQLENSEREI